MPPSRRLASILVLCAVLVVMSVVPPPSAPPVGPAVVSDAAPGEGRRPVQAPASVAPASVVPPSVAPASVVPPSVAPASVTAPAVSAPAVSAPVRGDVLEIPYRIELRSPDSAVADALGVIPAVLEDPRGWQQAAIDFVLTPDAPFVITVAEGEDAQALCQPYDVDGRYSCQNGPLVVLNAIRWREGVAHWPEDAATCVALEPAAPRTEQPVPPCLATYRTMLINHEVGHLLGMHHMRCTAARGPAPVMEQQSGTLRGCQANPWPTAIELRLAGTHQFTLAPPPLDVAFPP